MHIPFIEKSMAVLIGCIAAALHNNSIAMSLEGRCSSCCIAAALHNNSIAMRHTEHKVQLRV